MSNSFKNHPRLALDLTHGKIRYLYPLQPLQTEWQQLVVLFIQLVEGLILAKLLILKVRIILLSQTELQISQLKHGAQVAVAVAVEQLVPVAQVAAVVM